MLDHDAPILVFIGPSGVGKSRIVQELAKDDVIEVTPTWTTRPKRIDEAHDVVEHVFCADSIFEDMQGKGLFIDIVTPFNLPYRYGLSRIRIPHNNRVPVVMLRSFLLDRMKKHYSNITVYAIEADKELTRARLKQRSKISDSAKQLGSRLALYDQEINEGRKVAGRLFVSTDADVIALIKKAILEDFNVV